MTRDILSLYGLKFHPFRPGVPIEALFIPPPVDTFCRRVELALADGGFVMVTGEPGSGKSVVMRLLAHKLALMPDVKVGTISHPQSRCADFYREMGDLFGITLQHNNRWLGFKGLRQHWSAHITSSLTRPVLLVDEAQEMLSTVLNEIRILSSEKFDSQHLLCVVFAGDSRLPARFRSPDLLPLGSRIRRRLNLEYAAHDQLSACLDHLLHAAGNQALMSTALKNTLAEHAAGNYRVMMNLGDELLSVAAERGLAQLDESLYFDVFTPQTPARQTSRRA